MDAVRLLPVGQSWALVLVLMMAGAALITLIAAIEDYLETQRRISDYLSGRR